MEGLSGAASAITIVSLAVQLVDTVREITKFLRNVQDAPKEVLRLLETLDQLQGTLDAVRQLIDHQFLVLRLPGSPVFITKAMENCEKQIKALETLVCKARKSLEHQHMLRRTWSSMKFVAKKQDIEDIQHRLRDAKMDLQFAVSSNSWQLQMYHIQNTVPCTQQIRPAQSASTLIPVLDPNKDEDSPGHEVSSLRSINLMRFTSSYTEHEHVLRDGGMFGTMTLRKTSKYSQATSAGANRKTPLLLYARSFGYVSRSLNIYPVLSQSDPIFRMCADGDLLGLQTALSRQGVSPFVVDHDIGWTLLHYAAVFCQSETCNWLLQIGLDVEATDQRGLNALLYAGAYSRIVGPLEDRLGPEFESEIVDTLRTLAQHQDDVSASDLSRANLWYGGSPEGWDVLLANSSLHLERFDVAESVGSVPPLAVALRCYGRSFFYGNGPRLHDDFCVLQATYFSEYKQWERLLKKIIHKGADLHVPVSRYGYNPSDYSSFDVTEYGTPLDVLFQYSETPDEARTLGAQWLRLLSSQGHDVVAYLKKEMTLHAPEYQMTYPAACILEDFPPAGHELQHTLRELQFMFDDTRPCVWWEWWMDPASDIYLLEREFKEIVKHTCGLPDHGFLFLIDTWPFQYPVWYDNPEKVAQDWLEEGMRPAERLRRAHLAMQRANRRLEKRYAKNMSSKGLRHSHVPGAWPASSWD